MFSLRTLDEHADWLRQYLTGRGVTPPSGSAFYEALAAVERLGQLARAPPSSPLDDADFVALMRDAIGTDYMIEILRSSEKWLDTVPTDALRVLRGPDVNLMRIAPQSTERDVAWELFAGAVCTHFARDVRVLVEPDIRCTFRNSTWGVAAKVLYSTDPQQHIEQIIKGAKQIESGRADVDLGVVLVNGSTLLPHDAFFKPLRPGVMHTFEDPSEPARMLRAEADRFFRGINTGSLLRRLTHDKRGAGRTKTRRVLLFLQTLTSIRGVVATMSVCHSFNFRQLMVGDEDFWLHFHRAAQGTGLAPTFLQPPLRSA